MEGATGGFDWRVRRELAIGGLLFRGGLVGQLVRLVGEGHVLAASGGANLWMEVGDESASGV